VGRPEQRLSSVEVEKSWGHGHVLLVRRRLHVGAVVVSATSLSTRNVLMRHLLKLLLLGRLHVGTASLSARPHISLSVLKHHVLFSRRRRYFVKLRHGCVYLRFHH